MKTCKSLHTVIMVLAIVFVFATTGCAMAQSASSGQSKPNVVFMLADNVGYGDIGGAFQG